MTRTSRTDADTLRQLAGEAGIHGLVLALQLRQVELELQNDELSRGLVETEAALARYTDLFDFAPVGCPVFLGMMFCDRLERIAMLFQVTLEQAEDGWTVAECPALPGCVSQGSDEAEALENIKEAITAWLWVEDQKALASLSSDADESKRPSTILVAV